MLSAMDRRIHPGLLLSLALALVSCSAPVSPTPLPTSTEATNPVVVPTHTSIPATATATWAAPTNLPATATPAFTPIPLEIATPKWIVVSLVRTISPPDYSRAYSEHGFVVYAPPAATPVFSLSREATSCQALGFSPDGQWLVYEETVGGQARLRLISTDWQTDQPLTDWYEASLIVIKGVSKLKWSPDSQWIAFEYSSWHYDIRDVYVVNVNSKRMTLIGNQVTAFSWSRASPLRLAYAIKREEGNGVYVGAIQDGQVWQPEKILDLRPREEGCGLQWQPQGNWLIVDAVIPCQRMSKVECDIYNDYVLDPATGEQIDPPTQRKYPGVTWGPGENELAFCGDITCSIYNFEQKAFIQELPRMPNGEWLGKEFLVYGEQVGPDIDDEWLIIARFKDGRVKVVWRTSEVNWAEALGPDFKYINGIDWYSDSSP